MIPPIPHLTINYSKRHCPPCTNRMLPVCYAGAPSPCLGIRVDDDWEYKQGRCFSLLDQLKLEEHKRQREYVVKPPSGFKNRTLHYPCFSMLLDSSRGKVKPKSRPSITPIRYEGTEIDFPCKSST
jgi:hypothetical protein